MVAMKHMRNKFAKAAPNTALVSEGDGQVAGGVRTVHVSSNVSLPRCSASQNRSMRTRTRRSSRQYKKTVIVKDCRTPASHRYRDDLSLAGVG